MLGPACPFCVPPRLSLQPKPHRPSAPLTAQKSGGEHDCSGAPLERRRHLPKDAPSTRTRLAGTKGSRHTGTPGCPPDPLD